MKKAMIVAVLAMQAAGVQAAAPAATVSAADPGAIAEALDFAGYKTTIATDDLGDPMISTELNGWPTTIYFYGCDDTTHQGCDALRLEAGFDRAKPWNGEEAMKISEKFRFAATYLDKDGDPWIAWDILTGDGIPTKVFLRAMREFGSTLESASEIAFAEENAAEEEAAPQ